MEVSPIAELLLLTAATGGSAQVLPALGLLAHKVRTLPLDASALVDAPETDVVLIDARKDLVGARATCRMVNATGIDVPVILILTEGGLMVVTSDWGADDFLLDASSPAEVEARLRLVRERATTLEAASHPEEISSGELYIDASGYTARLRGIPLISHIKNLNSLNTWFSIPVECSPGPSSSKRCGATTITGALAPLTSTFVACAPNLGSNTNKSLAQSETSVTGLTRQKTDARKRRNAEKLNGINLRTDAHTGGGHYTQWGEPRL